jgi:signal peptidase I
MSVALALTATLRRFLDLVLVVLILVVLSSLVVARVVPAITHAPAFVVGGGSMEPTIPLGSIVIDQPVVASDLVLGDVVSIRVGPQNAIFTHRIVRLVQRDGALWIETKGDANPTVDPSIVRATTVLGRVKASIPLIGYPVQLLSSMAGVAFLLSVGLVTLLAAWLLESLEDDQRAWLRRRRLEALDVMPIERAPEIAAG